MGEISYNNTSIYRGQYLDSTITARKKYLARKDTLVLKRILVASNTRPVGGKYLLVKHT